MMSKIKKGITFIVLLITSICFSQNDCIDFKDYEESQDWVKKTNLLNLLEKKNEILNRINCEKELNHKAKFKLTLYLNGYIFLSNNISVNSLNLLEKISNENYILTQSLCEQKNIVACNCNLGFLVFKKLDKPVLNEISNITFKTIKRKRERIKITLISNKKSEVNLNVESFSNENNNFENKKIKLRKGKNKITFKTKSDLKLIEFEQNNLKTIFIQ